MPALHINNLLQVPIKYEFLTNVGWHHYEIEPGKTMYHWWRINLIPEVPTPRIQFDAGMNGATNIIVRTLQWKYVQHPQSKEGASYHFNVTAGNAIELFQGEMPGEPGSTP